MSIHYYIPNKAWQYGVFSSIPVLNPSDSEEFEKIISANDLNGHIFIMASTGSGKTELIKLFYIRLAMLANASIVLFDPHGDLAIQCAKLMNDTKDIVYIDLTLKKGLTPTINPFRLKKRDEQTISIVAQELVTAFENIIGEDFSPNMEALLTPLIYILLRKGDSGIDELIRCLDDENNQDFIEYALQNPIKAHRDFIKNQFHKGKFTKTKEALATKLQLLLNNPIFANFITGESTFNLQKALDNKQIVIFRLPKGKMRKTLEPAAKLIMALIQGIAFKRADLPEELRPKTYLLCDEYQNFFGQISDEMLSESRKNHLYILGAHQYSSQLSNKSKDALMSAANIKIVGKNSHKDLKMMAEEIQVDLQSLIALKRGEFYIKVGSNDAVKIVTSDKWLGNNGTISDELWKKHLKYQKKHYYKEVLDATVIQDSSDDVINEPTTHRTLPIPSYEQ